MKPFLKKFAVCAVSLLAAAQFGLARPARAQSSEAEINDCKQKAEEFFQEAQEIFTRKGDPFTEAEIAKGAQVIDYYCARYPGLVVSKIEKTRPQIATLTKASLTY